MTRCCAVLPRSSGAPIGAWGLGGWSLSAWGWIGKAENFERSDPRGLLRSSKDDKSLAGGCCQPVNAAGPWMILTAFGQRLCGQLCALPWG